MKLSSKLIFMLNGVVKVSPDFKNMAKKSILAILLFILTYLILFILALGLTIFCGYIGIKIIEVHPSFYTLIAGLGIISIGFLILVFLIKFVFTRYKIDRSHLLEIYREDQPRLFSLIDEIVNQVQADLPKKVYLSSDVNASVFYDSNFWSMFLPIKKNLQIGLGLVNTVSVTEFKAILAHEFGHFSQRSMKVGSYVYNVNQIIYNMLYENNGFTRLVERLANIHGIVTLFVRVALAIVTGIQWILRKIYALVNLNYLALSREMEYHADGVAANIAGSAPMESALLRLDLANFSLDKVFTYYTSKIDHPVRPSNIYAQQHSVMNFLARQTDLQIKNQLPQVPLAYLSKYNKSKLSIKDQWSSHPSTEDRVSALNKLNIPTNLMDHRLAIELFNGVQEVTSHMTKLILPSEGFKGDTQMISTEEFMAEFLAEDAVKSFPKFFNGYFDDRNPIYDIEVDLNPTLTYDDNHLEELFNDDIMDVVYRSSGLASDIETIKELAKGNHTIKSFDYDGEKYTIDDCTSLSNRLEAELHEINAVIRVYNLDVLNFSYFLAKKDHKETVLIEKFKEFAKLNGAYEENIKSYTDIVSDLGFVQLDTPFSTISNNFLNLEPKEVILKERINEILSDPGYEQFINDKTRENLLKYVNEKQTYFWTFSNEYNNASLEILFSSLTDFQDILLKRYFDVKRSLLVYLGEIFTKN